SAPNSTGCWASSSTDSGPAERYASGSTRHRPLLGWLIAYASRRLTPAETKWAVVILPSTAVAAGLVWLWGRMNGRWGEPIAEGAMDEAVAQTWPWVVRGAAVTSALFLIWRSQRRR
ncbi:hypothetical protein AB0N88_15795, partial [Streptomyces sp. NPDC093516]